MPPWRPRTPPSGSLTARAAGPYCLAPMNQRLVRRGRGKSRSCEDVTGGLAMLQGESFVGEIFTADIPSPPPLAAVAIPRRTRLKGTASAAQLQAGRT